MRLRCSQLGLPAAGGHSELLNALTAHLITEVGTCSPGPAQTRPATAPPRASAPPRALRTAAPLPAVDAWSRVDAPAAELTDAREEDEDEDEVEVEDEDEDEEGGAASGAPRPDGAAVGELPPRPKTSRGRPGYDPFHYVSASHDDDRAGAKQGGVQSLCLDGPRQAGCLGPDGSLDGPTSGESGGGGDDEAAISDSTIGRLEAAIVGGLEELSRVATGGGPFDAPEPPHVSAGSSRDSPQLSSDWSVCSYPGSQGSGH